MPSQKENLELLHWQGLFAHIIQLLSLSKSGGGAAFSAGRESIQKLYIQLAEASTGRYIGELRANKRPMSSSISVKDAKEREELYGFFERIFGKDTLSVLREAMDWLQRMAEGQAMSQEDKEKGIKFFSAIDGAFNSALGNKEKGGKR